MSAFFIFKIKTVKVIVSSVEMKLSASKYMVHLAVQMFSFAQVDVSLDLYINTWTTVYLRYDGPTKNVFTFRLAMFLHYILQKLLLGSKSNFLEILGKIDVVIFE